jgi:hypothetical protein
LDLREIGWSPERLQGNEFSCPKEFVGAGARLVRRTGTRGRI